ncbi:MAG: MFS transporter [Chloroflexota bacterium]|nr:MFS transporter [Chloroflexota bacterium]
MGTSGETLRNATAPGRTLIIVCSALFFNVLNGTMLNVVLPVVGREFNVEPARLGWVVTGYLLVFGVSVPFYGRLADVYGARRLFVSGLCLYALSSLACALSLNYGMLLAGRLAQALGAAAIPGLGMALIGDAYPAERRGTALGYVSATIGTGSAIGPIAGGTITGLLNWHMMFLLSALSGLLVPFALRVLPSGERKSGEGMDLLGGILLGLSVGGALLTATEAARGDVGAPQVLVAAAMSIVSFVALVFRQRAADAPFVPRDLLHNRRYLALLGTSFSAMTANVATFVALPLLLNNVYNLSIVHVGLVLLPNALAVAVLGPLVGRLVDRIGGRMPVRIGLLVILAGQVAFASVGVGASVWAISLLAGVQGIGFALLNSPLTTMVSLAVGRERQASGLSINSMAFFLGGGFGTAILTAILTVRARATDALNPLHSGPAPQYSDAFLLFLIPLLIALGLSTALPGKESAQDTAPTLSTKPAGAVSHR